MKGKGAAEAVEVVGTLTIVLVLNVSMFLFTIIYMFDLNFRHDILTCGLCRRKSIEDGVSANEDIDSALEGEDESELARTDKKKRFCFRHNYRVKLILRRKILAS